MNKQLTLQLATVTHHSIINSTNFPSTTLWTFTWLPLPKSLTKSLVLVLLIRTGTTVVDQGHCNMHKMWATGCNLLSEPVARYTFWQFLHNEEA